MAKLIAVLLRFRLAEEIATHELLGNRRSALRKERRAFHLVVTAAPHKPAGEHADSDLREHARQAEVVDPVVRKKAFVLGGQNRVTHDRRNVLVARDLAVLAGQFDERFAAGVVHVADRGKLKTREGSQVGKILPAEVDVMELGDRQHHGYRERGGHDPDS